MWENKVNIYNVFELRAKTTCYFGVGALSKIKDIAEESKKKGINKTIVITDEVAYNITGAKAAVEEAFKSAGIEWVVFTDITPNPTVEQIDAATDLGKSFGAQMVLGIGGGSPIDSAKSVAILLEYTDKNATELYEQKFIPEKAKPIIAINTTQK